jgi:hypothetical protein
MISTMSHQTRVHDDLPYEFSPNPLIAGKEYKKWSQDTQPRMNVNEGATVWCKTNQVLDEMSGSMNQKLTGLADPKTLVQPMISIPIYDNDLWKSNDFMVPNAINDQRRQELWQNGYLVDDLQNIKQFIREEYTPKTTPANSSICQSTDLSGRSLYAAAQPSSSIWNGFPTSSKHNSPPMLTEFGYYPDQTSYNLPTNYPAQPCQLQSDLSEYNENIFTSTLQPGVYSKSQVTQEDSVTSNLGISYTQPFLPTYSSHVKRQNDGRGIESDDGVMYTQYDPNLVQQKSCTVPDTGVKMDDVYDPRFYGYGTEYRSYVDHLTGRPKFFYDDVDVHRRNKFICRNNIDFETFGIQTGPQNRPQYTNMEIREMAQNSFLDNSLSFRTELQQRLMQKNNNRAWQQKQAPITTNQFTRGGSSKAAGLTSTGYAGPRG